jgi:hypothetical protein
MCRHIFSRLRALIRAEQGAVVVWISVMMVSVFGVSALVIDMGRINALRAEMQRSCDAAALAGAKQLPDEALCKVKALDLSAANGFVDGEDGIEITCKRNPDGIHTGWYQVAIEKPVHFFFAPVLGYTDGIIAMSATATYTTLLPLYISSNSGEYGTNGIMNLSLFGPYAPYTFGDAYSTRWLNNGDENPHYSDHGYDFIVDISDNYVALNGTSIVKFEIFDPDTWNYGDAQNASENGIDEIRDAPGSPHPQPANKYTTTKYELYAPSDTPDDYTDDILLAETLFEPGDNWSDMQWVNLDGWTVDLATYGIGNYRVNIKSIDGSSENGFNLRAGPPLGEGDEFDPYNGTEITASGRLPINFNQSGSVDIDLGYIPSDAAGYTVYINKFDTDVGAKSVTYYDDFGNTWPGQLSGNGTFKLDQIDIPYGYGGGHLYAMYEAGSQDTSSWEMYFDGKWEEGPSELKLVD